MTATSRLETVREIVVRALDENPVSIELVGDQGNVNVAYEVSTSRGKYILRAKFDRKDQEQFIREKCCADLIRATDDWTPAILAVGIFEEHAYSIQEKVEGTVGSRYTGDLEEVWEQVGRYAAHFHEIHTPGYLRDAFRGAAKPDAPWCQLYFDSLGEADAAQLVAEGLLSREEFLAALNHLEPLKELVFRPTLAHGNLSLSNIIVDSKRRAHVIDWGSCLGHLGSALDLSELLAFDVAQEHVRAYMRGHGLPDSYREQNWLLLERLQLVRCLSNAHWLCESRSTRKQDLLSYVAKTKETLTRLKESSAP